MCHKDLGLGRVEFPLCVLVYVKWRAAKDSNLQPGKSIAHGLQLGKIDHHAIESVATRLIRNIVLYCRQLVAHVYGQGFMRSGQKSLLGE